MINLTKLQLAWLYAINADECRRCNQNEELLFTRSFLQRAGKITRWQDKNQKALQSLIDRGFIIVQEKLETWRSEDKYRLSDKARKELLDSTEVFKLHSWAVAYQPELL